jgi:hypothetical protein
MDRCNAISTGADDMSSLILTLPKLAAIGIHAISLHSEPGFATFTPGAYAVFDNGVTVGAVLNSHGDPSYYLGYTFQLGRVAKKVTASLTAGAITGYKAMPVAPLAVPSIKHDSVPLRVSYLPRPPWQGASDAIHFSPEWSIKP